MTLPNFVLIGANKGGTTSVATILRQHPDVFVSPTKEPRFFAFEGRDYRFDCPGDKYWEYNLVTNLEDYQALYSGVENERAVGEASTLYISSEHAARRIRHHVPSARIMAILRNPIDRAYSAYQMARSFGLEPLETFEEALEAEHSRSRPEEVQEWDYLRKSHYSNALSTYFELFPREQIRIFLYDDLSRDREGLLRDVCEFLEVDPAFRFDVSTRKNVTQLKRSETLETALAFADTWKHLVPEAVRSQARGLVKKVRAVNRKRPEPLSPVTRIKLQQHFREEVQNLEDLLQRDLSHWLS